MKKITVIVLSLVVLALFAVEGIAQQQGQTEPGKVYNPKITYAGTYSAEVLYYRRTKDDFWRIQPRTESVILVTCTDASNHLNSEGKWQGIIEPRGSCPKIMRDIHELPEWETGNRINYDELVRQRAPKW